jgi:hypothetical protein
MLLFRSDEHLTRWCKTWKQPRGATLTLAQGWNLAKAWYGDRLSPHWSPLSPTQAEQVFKDLGFYSSFWHMRKG